MTEKPPSPDSASFVNWERLRQNPQFQEEFLHALADIILTKRYPDFWLRAKARFDRLRQTGSRSPDATDLEQKDFERRVHALASMEDLRRFSEAEGIPFPEGQELREAEEKALRMYNIEIESEISGSFFEDEPS